MDMLDKSIKFKEALDDGVDLNFYFTAKKHMLGGLFPGEIIAKADGAEICIKVSNNDIDASEALVSISPISKDRGDYEWRDIVLPVKEVKEMLDLGYKLYWNNMWDKGVKNLSEAKEAFL
jgi:hypothetical protein